MSRRDTFRDLRSPLELAVGHRMPCRADVPPLCERCKGADYAPGGNPVCPGPYSRAEQLRIVELLGVKNCLELGCGATSHKCYCIWFRG